MGDFEKRITDILGTGFLSLGIAIGIEQGLFKSLAKFRKPVTANELAQDTDCKERYCYEWLSMMVTERIVEVDETGQIFSFPSEHAGILTNDNWAAFKHIPLLAQSHMQLMRAFKKDGPRGLNCKDFEPWFREFKNNRPDDIYATVPKLVQQVEGLEKRLKTGIKVCDIGASQGTLLLFLAKEYPSSKFYGLDISEEDINTAKEEAAKAKITNVEFILGDAGNLPAVWKESFDLVILFHTLHHLPCASRAASEAWRILKKGGTVSVFENSLHSNPRDNIANDRAQMYYIYGMYYCLSASMNTEGSEALGPCAGIEKMESLLTNAGFEKMKKFDLEDENAHIVGQK